jgi:hypothetical protein
MTTTTVRNFSKKVFISAFDCTYVSISKKGNFRGNCEGDAREDMETQRIGASRLQNFIDISFNDMLLRFGNGF